MGEWLHALHVFAPGVLQRVDRFLDAGGVVIWPLLMLGFAMWYLIAMRAIELRHRVRPEHVERLLACESHPAGCGIVGCAACQIGQLMRSQEASFHDVELVLRRWTATVDKGARAIHALVITAPLLGLLGTVVGMMETFHSLQEMSMFAETGGVAGGISEALVTTQTGLGIAIPGLIVERALNQRGRAIERELGHLEKLARRHFASLERAS